MCEKKIKIQFLLFILLQNTTALFAGIDFFALSIPESMQNELKNIQTYVKDRLPEGITLSETPIVNMHITLKEIGYLTEKQRDKIYHYFEDLAKTYKPFSITDSIKGAKIRFSKKGLLKLILKENNTLTKLAKDIENCLMQAQNKNEIPKVKKRMDFPKNGHITLGQLIKDKKPLKNINIKQERKDLKDILSKFINGIKSNFDVQNFVLLKSNAPIKPRIYELTDVFEFSNK